MTGTIERILRATEKPWVALVSAAALVFAVRLLLGALYAFSWQNFLMSDYGVYSNTLYNLAHGDGFRFLMDHSYLTTHLSFSLAVLAPLVWLYDAPDLLIFVQWGFLIGGGAILWRTASRLSMPPVLRAAMLFLWLAYPFTQSVILSEFHGVAAYLLLVPWLLHCACFHRRWVVLPWVMILGMREEAGLFLVPLLLYLSVRHRWRAGYGYAALALVYVGLAIFWLYPWINGVDLFSVRAPEATRAGIFSGVNREGLRLRGWATFWMLLPYLPFLALVRNGRWALLCPVLLAWLISMASGMQRQYSLTFHYPAVIVAFLTTGLVLASAAGGLTTERQTPATWKVWLLAVWIVGSTLAAHLVNGFFFRGGASHGVYGGWNPSAPLVRTMRRHLPREGTLVCSQFLAPQFAMRPDIAIWRYWDSEAHPADWIVFDLGRRRADNEEEIRRALESGEFGVYHTELPLVLLRRGHATEENPRMVEALSGL